MELQRIKLYIVRQESQLLCNVLYWLFDRKLNFKNHTILSAIEVTFISILLATNNHTEFSAACIFISEHWISRVIGIFADHQKHPIVANIPGK